MTASHRHRRRTRHTASTAPAGPRTALLVDLENMLFHHDPAVSSSWTDPQTTCRILQEVRALAGPVDYTVGVGAFPVLSHILNCCAGPPQGMPLRQVQLGRDLADVELVELGHHLIASGFARLVIASGDGRFAELAASADWCRVIARGRSHLSTILQAEADEVQYLTAVRALTPTTGLSA